MRNSYPPGVTQSDIDAHFGPCFEVESRICTTCHKSFEADKGDPDDWTCNECEFPSATGDKLYSVVQPKKQKG